MRIHNFKANKLYDLRFGRDANYIVLFSFFFGSCAWTNVDSIYLTFKLHEFTEVVLVPLVYIFFVELNTTMLIIVNLFFKVLWFRHNDFRNLFSLFIFLWMKLSPITCLFGFIFTKNLPFLEPFLTVRFQHFEVIFWQMTIPTASKSSPLIF
jgi:hypothetical protein